ncbi:hypothetical protein J6590_086304 [Homalodisca vitripennis]|nr:hypothetical protein J6590_086304 [Homalodisca vitripennis]
MATWRYQLSSLLRQQPMSIAGAVTFHTRKRFIIFPTVPYVALKLLDQLPQLTTEPSPLPPAATRCYPLLPAVKCHRRCHLRPLDLDSRNWSCEINNNEACDCAYSRSLRMISQLITRHGQHLTGAGKTALCKFIARAVENIEKRHLRGSTSKRFQDSCTQSVKEEKPLDPVETQETSSPSCTKEVLLLPPLSVYSLPYDSFCDAVKNGKKSPLSLCSSDDIVMQSRSNEILNYRQAKMDR